MESGGFMFDSSCFQSGNLFLGNGGDSLFRGTNTLMGLEQISKRQSFFGSSDMLFHEDYYDDQLADKKRRLTPEQMALQNSHEWAREVDIDWLRHVFSDPIIRQIYRVQLLEKSFETENKLEPERKSQLAKKLGLQPRQVAVWFQNRRARWKTKQLERDYDLLKSSYDTLLSNFDLIKKQNQKLKLELASLNKEQQPKDIAIGETAGIKSGTLPPHEPLQIIIKVEDRLSSGSGGSAVVDGDGPHLLDSGNSCFPRDEYNHCMTAEQWEEDYGNSHGCGSHFLESFAVSEDQIQEEGVPLGWWPWP